MKKNELILKLSYGVFVCTLIGFIFSISIGVQDKTIYNYIVGASNCLLLTTIDCLLMLIETSKYCRKKLNIKNFIIIIPYSLISFLLGIIYILILNKGFNVEICKISRFITASYQTLSSILISTIMANDIIKRYIKKI